jgi:sporulation protein YunB
VIHIKNIKTKFFIIFLTAILLCSICLYELDKTLMPVVMSVADLEIRAKVMKIMNVTISNEYSEQFNYNEIINIERDSEENINIINADTLKMNKIACDVAIKVQNELNKLKKIGVILPSGYIFKNNLLAQYGPDININVEPVGYVEARYLSNFESVGINQTRHKIYVELKTNMRIAVPLEKNDIEIKSQIPISETIIIGKVPDTAINMDLDNTKFKLKNKYE